MDGRTSSFGARRRALADGSASRIASASGQPPVWRESRWFNGSEDTDDITLVTDGGRESSLASWQEDDFDRQASSTVHALFAAIDASLYENQPLSDALLERECRDWAARFAHLRVVGACTTHNDRVSSAPPHPPSVTIDTTGQLHGINVPTLDEYSTDQSAIDDDEQPTTSAQHPPPSQRRHSQTSIDSNEYNTGMMPVSMDVINEITKMMLPKVTAQILPTKKLRTSKRVPNGVHRALERQSILRRTIPDKARVSTVKHAAASPPPTAQRNIRFASSQPQLHVVPVPSTSGGADWRNSSEHWWERHYRAASTHVARHTPKSADNVRLPPIGYRYTVTSQSQRAMSTRSWGEKPTTSTSAKTTVSDGHGTAKSGMPRLLARRNQMHQHRVISRSRSTNSVVQAVALPTVQPSATSKSTVDSAYASAEHSRRGTHKISSRHKPRTMSISPQRRLHHA